MSRDADAMKIQMFARSVTDATSARPAPDDPFKLLVMADFSGRASRGSSGGLGGRKPLRVDRDDLEAVLAGLEPELSLETRAEGQRLSLSPRSLEDLHPDALWERLDVFAELRALRRRLSNPETFAAAAAEVRGAAASAPEGTPDPTQEPGDAGDQRPAPDPADGSLLEATLQETDAVMEDRGGSTLVDAILRDLVIPRIPATPGQEELIAGIDAAAAEEMRALLHAPELRRLESAWRALELLVRRVETDARLQIWIFDVTAAELVQDLGAHEDPRQSDTWRTLFESDAADGAPRWAAWTSLDLSFGATEEAAQSLMRIARLAATAAAPFLAAAREEVAGCASLAASADPDDWEAPSGEGASAWTELRALPEAGWLLLTVPRLLLRSTYGRRNSPLERFSFEELSSPPHHEEFLWGSGALAPTLALAQEYTRRGWALTPEAVWEIDHLPVPIYEQDGENEVQPCAEVVLTERGSDALRAAGLLPLATVRDSDRIRFGPLTSVGGTLLAGRWFA